VESLDKLSLASALQNKLSFSCLTWRQTRRNFKLYITCFILSLRTAGLSYVSAGTSPDSCRLHEHEKVDILYFKPDNGYYPNKVPQKLSSFMNSLRTSENPWQFLFFVADYWTRVRCENGISTCYPNTQILTIKGKWDFPECVAVVSWGQQRWVVLGILRSKGMEATGGWRKGKYGETCCFVCRERIWGSRGYSTCCQLYALTFFLLGKQSSLPSE